MPMPVTCCMLLLFGSHFGQNGSTLNTGAPPSSSACAGCACECNPRLERTTTRETSPNALAALRIAAILQVPGLGEDLQTRVRVFLPCKGRKANGDRVERRVGLRTGAFEVVHDRAEHERLAVAGGDITGQ